MSNLRARAAAASAGDEPVSIAPRTDPAPAGPPLEVVDAPEGIDADPERVPIAIALARVMRDIGKIVKADKFTSTNAGSYSYRGIDRVVNAVGPVLRKHGVIVVPDLAAVDYRDVARAGGGRSHECVVTMRYRWIGPGGDEIVSTVQGESLDTSDKSTAKAQSVAWRVCLVQTLAIPTGDPDPDAVRIERGEAPQVRPAAYVDEICSPRTSLGRLKQIRSEINAHGIGGAIVTNEVGDDEKLGDLITRIGRERQAAAGGSP